MKSLCTVFYTIRRPICHISICLTGLAENKRHCVFWTRLMLNSATDSPKSRWLTSDPHNMPLNVRSSLPTVKNKKHDCQITETKQYGTTSLLL